jgi:histidinol-phosphate aminotransferase
MIKIPEWILNLKPYIPGKPISELAREKSLERIVKLASNENPLGPSPKAMKAVIDSLSDAHRYVDRAAPELVSKIATKFGKNPDQIICGHGVDALLGYILSAFTRENDEVVTSEGTFIGIYVNTLKLGRNLSLVPLKNYAFDLEAILSSISSGTRVIYLANPNNPTGTIFTKRQFEAFIERVPEDILVILDEAYTEFASKDPEFPNGLDYDYDNLIITRTLSKSYGLAGLRVGFAAGPEKIISELYKVKLPFEPNYAAQKAAIAAMDDDEFLERTLQVNERSLSRMTAKFDEMGIKYVNTHANFLLLVMPSEKFAESFNEECLNSGLILRHVKPFGIPNGIRINSSTEEETEFALDVIEKVYPELLRSSPS